MFFRRRRKVISRLPALTLIEAFHRPGPSLFDDLLQWEMAVSFDLKVRAEVERSRRGLDRRDAFAGEHAKRRMAIEARV